jgi:predicted RNA binding protein YcfA (HicA-like mRNA interferase family)
VGQWRSARARRVLAALLRLGWSIKRQTGWADITFAFHDDEEIGPKMLAKIAAVSGLTPDDL